MAPQISVWMAQTTKVNASFAGLRLSAPRGRIAPQARRRSNMRRASPHTPAGIAFPGFSDSAGVCDICFQSGDPQRLRRPSP